MIQIQIPPNTETPNKMTQNTIFMVIWLIKLSSLGYNDNSTCTLHFFLNQVLTCLMTSRHKNGYIQIYLLKRYRDVILMFFPSFHILEKWKCHWIRRLLPCLDGNIFNISKRICNLKIHVQLVHLWVRQQNPNIEFNHWNRDLQITPTFTPTFNLWRCPICVNNFK